MEQRLNNLSANQMRIKLYVFWPAAIFIFSLLNIHRMSITSRDSRTFHCHWSCTIGRGESGLGRNSERKIGRNCMATGDIRYVVVAFDETPSPHVGFSSQTAICVTCIEYVLTEWCPFELSKSEQQSNWILTIYSVERNVANKRCLKHTTPFEIHIILFTHLFSATKTIHVCMCVCQLNMNWMNGENETVWWCRGDGGLILAGVKFCCVKWKKTNILRSPYPTLNRLTSTVMIEYLYWLMFRTPMVLTSYCH